MMKREDIRMPIQDVVKGLTWANSLFSLKLPIRALLFVVSWMAFLFAQPDLSLWACSLTASLGYGCLLSAISDCPVRVGARAVFLWCFFGELYHFSWLVSDKYVGKFILFPWLFVSTFLGISFVFFFLCLRRLIFTCRPLTVIIGGAFLWVFLEKLRYLGFFSGLSFDFSGFSLTGNPYYAQCASFLGVFGLTLLVMSSSLTFYFCIRSLRRSFLVGWILINGIPYLAGGAFYHFHAGKLLSDNRYLSVALVQPAFKPETGGMGVLRERLLALCRRITVKPDLIVFPEAMIPCGLESHACSLTEFQDIITRNFGAVRLNFTKPELNYRDYFEWLSSYFDCGIVIGTEVSIYNSGRRFFYNSAVLLSADEGEMFRYDKRILVPIGEYLPGGRIGAFIVGKYFPQYFSPYFKDRGRNTELMRSSRLPPFGVSICYEETFGDLIRIYKLKGASFLVNLTNDMWYPRSRLPEFHFLHGVLRNIELGLSSVRACNTGVTGGVDSLGRIVAKLPSENSFREALPEVLIVKLPLYSYTTPYSFLGDACLMYWSLFATLFVFVLLLCPTPPYCQKRRNKIN
ncbi:MAG: apolipoprotein N-acyltransferase [Victivallaceae bacterium]